MSAGARVRWVVVTSLAMWLRAGAARAQTGWALDRYEPSVTGDPFVVAEHPGYARRWSAGLTVEHAARPLVQSVDVLSMATVQSAVVSRMTVAHLGASAALWGRLGFHLSVPLSLDQDGARGASNAAEIGPADGPALGDVRAGVRVRVLGDAEANAASLHLGGALWLPTGTRASNTGDGAARGDLRAVVAGRAGPVRWSFAGAFQFRETRDVLNLALGDEIRLTAAVGLVLLRERVQVGSEAYAVTGTRGLPLGLGGLLFGPNQWGSEVLFSARFQATDALSVSVAGGFGAQAGHGIPAARGALQVVWSAANARPATRPMDGDGDGVIDGDDLCPTAPSSGATDPSRRGCPAALEATPAPTPAAAPSTEPTETASPSAAPTPPAAPLTTPETTPATPETTPAVTVEEPPDDDPDDDGHRRHRRHHGRGHRREHHHGDGHHRRSSRHHREDRDERADGERPHRHGTRHRREDREERDRTHRPRHRRDDEGSPRERRGRRRRDR